ncbi:MAG: M24 family metallopeptidase [Rhodovibrionaceae bacterium]
MKPGKTTTRNDQGLIPNQAAMARYRVARIRKELEEQEAAAALFMDPVNVRYCTGSRNMQIWSLRNPARYVLVPLTGPVVMFEFSGCEHLLSGLEIIDEIRPATAWFFFTAGPRLGERAGIWATEIADLVQQHGGGNMRLAIDRVNPEGYQALCAKNVEVIDGQQVAERARAIKSVDEVLGIESALDVAEHALRAVEEKLSPGITENELLGILHHENLIHDGEYGETRLLTSGPRTNPWYQEASNKAVEAGELVAIDTDLIGPGGFFADLSRTFLCGDRRPTGPQRDLYALAYEQLQHNVELIRPGASFREVSMNSWYMPEVYRPRRYMSLVHGAGLSGEYPYIPYPQDFAAKGYEGHIEENMTLCVESYIGSVEGREGVKLETPVLVTESGTRVLGNYPYESRMLR